MAVIQLESIRNFVNKKYNLETQWLKVNVDGYGIVDVLHSGNAPTLTYNDVDGFGGEGDYDIVLLADDLTNGGIDAEGAKNGVLVIRGTYPTSQEIAEMLSYQ